VSPSEGNGSRPPLRLGGMALRNGLLIHGPNAWGVAARAEDGSIEVASGAKPVFAPGRLGSTPILRGPLRMAEAMAVIPLARLRLRSARLPFEDRRVIAAALASTVASSVLRRLRPADHSGTGSALREGALALLGLLPALAALRDRDLAAYHGAEHKAIGAYERGSRDPTVAPKEHERCGSNLIAPLMAFSITGQIVIEGLFEHPGPVARAVAGVGSLSAAVEAFAYAERHPGSAIGRAVQGPGHEIQRLLSTREPTPEQLAVSVAALEAVLDKERALQGGGEAAGTV
jgi:uncharacterized protein YqhQ